MERKLTTLRPIDALALSSSFVVISTVGSVLIIGFRAAGASAAVGLARAGIYIMLMALVHVIGLRIYLSQDRRRDRDADDSDYDLEWLGTKPEALTKSRGSTDIRRAVKVAYYQQAFFLVVSCWTEGAGFVISRSRAFVIGSLLG
jgi:hypothetical protein